ncbi:mannose-6-phosphate isomerase, class I [Microtetraspora niveoalba]|uniref:mannose-6-phosphate isomerase, class I n=1 Tax=Microtetraspora niveoalba TaxID=46175 RepID=UPI0009FE74E8|nr:mannose-6-phosphate isomerase, class I [Microtetraspora niveoalba]
MRAHPPVTGLRRLTGTVRSYAWGSRSAIASLQGRPVPTPVPEAELWLGTHPGAPSHLGGRPLPDVVAADPRRVLGAAVADEFGPRLPYLMKLLAAEEPLSLQAHPDAAHARTAYAAEEAAGLPPEERNYRDGNHKPELLVAVTEFEALCGFRPPGEAAGSLARLGVPGLRPLVDRLGGPEPARALREAVTLALTLPARARADLVGEVAAACAGLGGADPAYEVAARLARLHPGDAGVVVSLLLNHVRLAPAQAVWMPAGNPHAYLRGVGVEVMAAGDNVLRGGLTRKRVDVPELLRVLRFEPLENPVMEGTPVSPGVVGWAPPVREFALTRAVVGDRVPEAELTAPGARVLLCVSGRVTLADGAERLDLTPGTAAFAPAEVRTVTVSGHGEVFQATTP